MNTLINAILSNYVPSVIVTSLVAGLFALGIAGIIRNSGKNDDIARSNQIMQTVIVGIIMLFLSGVFVFAFNELYISKFYGQMEDAVAARLPNGSDINNTNLLSSQIQDTQTTITDPRCIF